MSKIFDEIIELMQEIHSLNQTLKFGTILQLSIDNHKRKKNLDLTQTSSKQLRDSLLVFKNKLEVKNGS